MDVDALAKRVEKLEKKLAKYEVMLAEARDARERYHRDRPLSAATRTEDPNMPTLGQQVAAAGEPVISPELHAQIHAPLSFSPEALEDRRRQALANEQAERESAENGDAADPELDENYAGKKIMRGRFAELGPDQVRTLLATGGLPQAWHQPATQWLAEKDPNSETDDQTGKQAGDTAQLAGNPDADEGKDIKFQTAPNNGQVDMGQGGSPSNASATGQNQGAGSTGDAGADDQASTAGKALPEPSLTEQPPLMEQPPQTGIDRIDDVADGNAAPVATDQGSTAKPA